MNPAIQDEFRSMLRLAAPLVLAELGWMSMGIVDTIMVGRVPNSAEAIGAVSLGSVLFYSIGIFGVGILLGLDTLVSQAFGAGDLRDCHRSLYAGLLISVLLTPPLMGSVLLVPPLLGRMRIHPGVFAVTVPYMRAIIWSTFPLLLFQTFRRYLQAMNVVQPIMFALISANLVNLVGNWVLIYGRLGFPAMGPEGSGWATSISRVYMALVLLVTILYHDRRLERGHDASLWQMPLRPDFERIRHLLRLGLPAASQLTIEVSIFGLVTALIARLDPFSLAGHQIAINAASFTFMMPLGISSAAAVRVGQAVGRNDLDGVRRAGWTALVLGAAVMACNGAAFLLAPQWISRIFTPDPRVIAAGVKLLYVAAVFQIFDGVQIVATGALRGLGDTRTPMICHLVAYWFIGLPLGYFLCFRLGWGAAGLWIGLCVGLILIGSVLLFAWHRRTHPDGSSEAPPRSRRS